jgi:hypothetical protein
MVNFTVSESLIISFWKLGVAGLDLDLLCYFSAGIDLILMAFECAEDCIEAALFRPVSASKVFDRIPVVVKVLRCI